MAQHVNVLVTDSERGAGDAAREQLIAAGHTVLSCHEPDAAAFPCKALDGSGECPLDTATVDVALAVRSRIRSQPALQEDGIACALRRHIPLVVAASPILNPFEDYATAVVDSDTDIVDACVRAANAPLRVHTDAAARALRDVLDRRHINASPLVTVTRRDGVLHVDVQCADSIDRAARSMAAVRMTSAVRAIDRSARGLDVVFHDARPVSR
jgi:hypothetical protein